MPNGVSSKESLGGSSRWRSANTLRTAGSAQIRASRSLWSLADLFFFLPRRKRGLAAMLLTMVITAGVGAAAVFALTR